MRRGLRLRLVVTHALVAALAVAAVALVVHVAGERRFESYLAEVRGTRAAAIVQILAQTYRQDVGWDAMAVYALSQAARLDGVNLAVYSAEGQLQFTVEGIDGNASASPEDASGATPGAPSASPSGGALPARAYDISRYPVVVGGETVATVEVYTVRAARAAAESDYLDAAGRVLLLAALLAVALALLVSVLVSRRVTAPLEELTDAAADVAAGNLDARVAPRGDDEVAALAAAFNAMADALARDAEWRREMTADLSQELRTPLATIQVSIEALEDGELPATRENLRVIGEEVERLSRLLGALRSLNELEAQDLDVELVQLDLRDVAAEALEQVAADAGARGVTLGRDLRGAPARGDHDGLLQVIGSLLDNALKFTPEGGTVTVTTTTEGGSAVLAVADTGPGIEAVDLPFVFDRFYRSQAARGTQGVGLGLAVAKGLVETYGGTIDVQSGVESGAVFTVRLPPAGA